MFPSSLSPETCPNPLELVSSFFGVVIFISPFYGLPLLVGVLLWERSARKNHPGVNRLVRDASLINLILAPLAFGVTYGIAHALSWSYQAPFWLGIGFCGLWAANTELRVTGMLPPVGFLIPTGSSMPLETRRCS